MIFEKVNEMLKQKDIVNIAISGMTCSGKSTLASRLKEEFSKNHSVTIIEQDCYFKDKEQFKRGSHGFLMMDSPEAFCIDEFRDDVIKLLTTFKTVIPRYEISLNRRISKNTKVNSGRINIFEGLHTVSILNGINNLYKVFLDTDISTCLERRIERDVCLHGIQAPKIREYFNICILPVYNDYIFPQKTQADFIITNNI